jgi:hypothetical protein
LGQGLCSAGSGCGAGPAPVTAKAGSPPSAGSGVSLEATLSSSKSSVVTFPAIAAATTTTFTRLSSLRTALARSQPCWVGQCGMQIRILPERSLSLSRNIQPPPCHSPPPASRQRRQLPRPWQVLF